MNAPIPAATWRGFTLDTPDEEIRARFAEVYGRPPQTIFTSGPLKLAGPIPELKPSQLTRQEHKP